ncbi:ligase-associated DNA damage response endonuclease PdeM [Lacinutrix salivirga]
MKIITKSIVCNSETFTLTNQRVLFWDAKKALILSDLHIGKSAHFRKHGIPISSQVLDDDLERLQLLINHFNAETLIIVGDLFHAEYNTELETFKNWLKKFPNLKLQLIIGNHDKLNRDVYEAFNIKIYKPSLTIETINFVHNKLENSEENFTISGHTHPGVYINGKGKQRIKLPCFQVTEFQLVLPAFSLFTGLNTRSCPDNCTQYAFTDSGIFMI